MTVSMLTEAHDRQIGVSRLKHAHAANPTIVPAGTETIGHNDLVTVVGPRAVLDDVAGRLGHVSSHDIVEDRHDLDFRRVTLSNKPLVGHTVGELDLEPSSGPPSAGCAAVTSTWSPTTPSCSRWATGSGSSRHATGWPRSASTWVTATAGMSDINVGGLALGLAVGIAIGLVHVPTPGGGFTIGAAAGTLSWAGLRAPRPGRAGHHLDVARAAQSLSALGMVTFLAYAGVQRRTQDH